jgi:chloride channel protein, CIC family
MLSATRPFGVRLLRRFLRLAPNEKNRLFVLTVVIGGVCGLAAVAFHGAIQLASELLLERSLAASGWTRVTATVLTPTLGALGAGLLLQYVLPNVRGSGIPQVKLVYAVKSGRLRLRDAFGKFFIGALQLGTGSSLGREGPTVQICASLSSALGRLFAISPNNTRRLIPVGAAAGIAAAFNAPIAAVTFTIEEIIGDLDQTLLSGVVVAAALAAAVEHSILGEHPVFSVPGSYRLEYVSSLFVYALLGVAAALLSRLFCSCLLGLRQRFRAVPPLGKAALPALGGLATGLLAVALELGFDTQGVLGDGYSTLSQALSGTLSIEIMAILVVVKLAATVLCYSTGGAGGIFAPVLFIGAMLGGVFGRVDQLMHHGGGELGGFALVGMGAFFAAVIRAPITSVLIIFEMTHGYGLILPLMIANSVAYVFARHWQPVPIYEALLEQDGFHVPQTQRAVAALGSFRVHDAMTTELVTVQVDESIDSALAHVAKHGFSMYPVVDQTGGLRGLVSEARLRRRIAEGRGSADVESEARAESYLRSDLPLVEAVAMMSGLGSRQMAVVEQDNGRLVGVLAMSDIMRAHTRAVQSTDLAAPPPDSLRPALNLKKRDASLAFQHPPREPDDIPPRQ